MQRKVVHGTRELLSAQADSNGFVNRRSTVQSRPPAQSSDNRVTKDESGCSASAERGFNAALAAGRQPVDVRQFGVVDRAVVAEIGRYQLLARKRPADRKRLRAVLISYAQVSS